MKTLNNAVVAKIQTLYCKINKSVVFHFPVFITFTTSKPHVIDTCDITFYSQNICMDSKNKSVHVLQRQSCSERALSLGWIITFHADDNREMSALRSSPTLHLSTLLLNCEQNGSYWLLQFPRGGLCPVLCLTFHSPVEHGRCCKKELHTITSLKV